MTPEKVHHLRQRLVITTLPDGSVRLPPGGLQEFERRIRMSKEECDTEDGVHHAWVRERARERAAWYQP